MTDETDPEIQHLHSAEDTRWAYTASGDRYCLMCAELDRALFTGSGEGEPRGILGPGSTDLRS